MHCQVGLNRSPLLVALMLIRHRGMLPEEAIALLRAKRDPQVLFNQHFEAFLHDHRGVAVGV